MDSPYYIEIIEEAFKQRREKNSKYSLRAYAHFLEIHSGTLSAIRGFKRPLTKESAEKIAEKLNLSETQTQRFLESLSLYKKYRQTLNTVTQSSLPPINLESESPVDAQLDWQQLAILNLMKIPSFRSCNIWIADRLGLSKSKVDMALSDLESKGLATRDYRGHWKKTTRGTHELTLSSLIVSNCG